MGKSNRRRASRGAAAKSASHNGSAAPAAPTAPAETTPEVEVVISRRAARVNKSFSKIMVGMYAGFCCMYPGGFFQKDPCPLDLRAYDTAWKVQKEGLLALDSWFLIAGVILGVAVDWTLALLGTAVTFLFYDKLFLGLMFVAYCYSLPMIAFMLRVVAWSVPSWVMNCQDAPVPLRYLVNALQIHLILPHLTAPGACAEFFRFLLSSPAGLLASLLLCFVWFNYRGASMFSFMFFVASLPLTLVHPDIGKLVFCYLMLLCALEVRSPNALRPDSVNQNPKSTYVWCYPRWETPINIQHRTAYWKTYHRERGHAEAIKIMEKIERRRCDVCGLEGAVTGPRFGVCDACGVRTYCSELCQQGDWEYGGHKEECAGSASNR